MAKVADILSEPKCEKVSELRYFVTHIMFHHNVRPICWLHSAPSCLPKFTPFSPHPDLGSENVNAAHLPTDSKCSGQFPGSGPTFSRQFPGPARISTPISGPSDSHTQNIADNADTRFRHKHDPDRHDGRLGMISRTRSKRRNEAVSAEGTTSHAASESSICAKSDSLFRKRSMAPRSNHDLIHRNMAMSPLTSQGMYLLSLLLPPCRTSTPQSCRKTEVRKYCSALSIPACAQPRGNNRRRYPSPSVCVFVIRKGAYRSEIE